MKKKVLAIIVFVLVITIVGAYFAIPIVVSNVVRAKITEHPENTVGTITMSWGGPQTISELHVEDSFGFADVHVELNNGLFSLLSSEMYNINVTGEVTIHTLTDASKESSIETRDPSRDVESVFSMPAISLTAEINTLTILSDEPLVYNNIRGKLSAKPGRVFNLELTGKSDSGGIITCEGNAPDLLTEQGTLNWDSTATLSFTIKDAAIPTINGQGGWSIISMSGELSSPKLRDAINITIDGELAEYGIPKGRVMVKTQLISTEKEWGAFVFDDKEVVGTIDLVDVPTTLLAPLLHKHGIDPLRDFGPTMNVHLERVAQGPPMRASFTSEKLQASCIIDNDGGMIAELELSASVDDELVQLLTGNQLWGSARAIIHFDQLVPLGFSSNDAPECVGSIDLSGELLHVESSTTIERVHADFFANLRDRQIGVNGSVTLNSNDSDFDLLFHSANKNKLHSFIDLYKTIMDQLPQGTGKIVVKDIPTKIVRSFLDEEQRAYLQYIGSSFSSNAVFNHNGIHIELASAISTLTGTVQLKGKEFASLKDTRVQLNLSEELSSTLFRVPFRASSKLIANIKSLDRKGNALFDVSFDIGKQHTFIEGTTTRQTKGERKGQLDANLNVTGIDTRLLDVMLGCDGLLADTLGFPADVEIIARDIMNDLIIVASGNSPTAVYEASIGVFDGTLFTIEEGVTGCDLMPTDQLTQHLLNDLSPLLSQIRNVQHPIQMRVSNVSIELGSGIAGLNADVYIDIGEAEIDNGFVLIGLMSLAKSKHTNMIPVFFDPISIEIRNGISTCKKFYFTLDHKYSIPYSGMINYVTRELDLVTAVPLSGLGYSIKEIRGLSEDVDVPYFITGTIDDPIIKADPNFDLSKLILNVGISAIGDALSGDKKDAPNPLDLIEDLFGDH